MPWPRSVRWRSASTQPTTVRGRPGAFDGIEAGPAAGLRYVLLVLLLSLWSTWIVSRIPVARRVVT